MTNPQIQFASQDEQTLNRAYEKKIFEMQEHIKLLEFKLIDNERRTKKEYGREIKRLKKQLSKKNALIKVEPEIGEDRPLARRGENRAAAGGESPYSSCAEVEFPIDYIKEKINKMNENLTRLEQKYAFDE